MGVQKGRLRKPFGAEKTVLRRVRPCASMSEVSQWHRGSRLSDDISRSALSAQ